jgi:hypothetical protein
MSDRTNTRTKQQCDAIVATILQAGLPLSYLPPRTGVRPHRISRAQHSAFGIPNLCTSRGIANIERILKYRYIDDEISGQLIRASTEQLKLEIGRNGPTLSLPCAEFAGLATKCRLRHTWQFMDAYQMRIKDTSPAFLLSRDNDQLLIQLFHAGNSRPPTPPNQSVPPFPSSAYDLRYHNRLRHQGHQGCMEQGTRHDPDDLLPRAHPEPTNRSGLVTSANDLDNPSPSPDASSAY